MSHNRSLKAVAHGAGIIFVGYILTYIIAFLYRVLIARYLGPSDYGVFMLAIAVLGVGRTISLLGMSNGVKRYIGYYIGLNDSNKVKGVILSSIKIVLPFGIIIGILIYVLSPYISFNIFSMPGLMPILKIFAIIIPLNALIELFKAVFISFKKVVYSSFIEVCCEKLLNLIFVSIAIVIGGKLLGVAIAYLTAYLVTVALGFLILEFKVFSIIKSSLITKYEYRELLSFSIPLLLIGMVGFVLSWGDTFLLGFFTDKTVVGIYNVGFSLAYSLFMFSRSFETLYYPISAQLLAQRKLQELIITFDVITRWIFILVYPAALLLILFSNDIIRILFGIEYILASKVLPIIVLGVFFSSILGPAGITLQTFKKTKFIFKVTFFFSVCNILLNIMLIPVFGMVGAAIATAVSWALMSLVFYLKLNKMIRLRSNRRYILKYIAAGGISLLVVFSLLRFFVGYLNLSQVVLGLIIFLVLYCLLLLLFRSFSEEDLMILSAIEQRVGIRIPFKGIIRKYL